VNAVGENANGEESPSPFFRKFARLSLYHYQCSKESTSTEIAAVFEKASRRQKMVDPRTNRIVVFMDEAGLPEESRESLKGKVRVGRIVLSTFCTHKSLIPSIIIKVLHYLLENQSEVGFVTITNHVLDAAKSNRCVMLFRQEPDQEEMLTMTQGILFESRKDGSMLTNSVDLEGQVIEAGSFARRLCDSYAGIMQNLVELPWLDTFFGLRDYVYFLKALRFRSFSAGTKMAFSVADLLTSIERNFNGLKVEDFKLVVFEMLRHVTQCPEESLKEFLEKYNFCPLQNLQQALMQRASTAGDLASRARFTLIIDGSNDDSILRILGSIGILDLSKKTLFKLSQMEEDRDAEKTRLVAGVTYAAQKGQTVMLSQTESDESFYDLQNQNFHEIEAIDGTISFYANIAAGGVSRRCPVHPSFHCIVHVRESQLDQTPAQFLNRFEKVC
jgi:E3 ubiquitin-protein ligase RNF213